MLTDQLLNLSSIAHEIVLWFLIVLSVLSLAVILERFFLLKNFLSETSLILSEITSALESGRNSHMKLVYDKYSLLPAGKLLQKAWEHIIEKRDRGLEEMMNAHLLALKPQMETRLGFLATVGSNAPFIGLLGTIFGVMEAFSALGSSTGSSAVVMAGISKALVATALGLIVAIPAITAYNFLQKQLKMIFHNMESSKETLLSFAKNCHSK